MLGLLVPSFVPGWWCSISLCWLPQGVLLLMILHLSCQSGWDMSSNSLQRSCAGMGAGRRVFCLSIGPCSSLGLCEGWWQMVLPAGALPGFLSLFSLLPQGRDGTWCLWRGLGAVWHSFSSVTLAVFCPLCGKLIEKKQKHLWIQNHIVWDTYVAIYLLIPTKIPLVSDLTWHTVFVTKDNDHKLMQMSLNDLSMPRSGHLDAPEFLCSFFFIDSRYEFVRNHSSLCLHKLYVGEWWTIGLVAEWSVFAALGTATQHHFMECQSTVSFERWGWFPLAWTHEMRQQWAPDGTWHFHGVRLSWMGWPHLSHCQQPPELLSLMSVDIPGMRAVFEVSEGLHCWGLCDPPGIWVSWFNCGWQLNLTQLFAHSHHIQGDIQDPCCTDEDLFGGWDMAQSLHLSLGLFMGALAAMWVHVPCRLWCSCPLPCGCATDPSQCPGMGSDLRAAYGPMAAGSITLRSS